MFENRALRGIFGPKREEVTRDWRRLRKEELNYSGDQTGRMTWMGPVARMEERRGADRVLAGNPRKETTSTTQG